MSTGSKQTIKRNTLRGRDLERKCFDLRRRGKDPYVIADELDIPIRRVHASLVRHMARHEYIYDNEVTAERRASLDRLNEYTEALYGRATGDETRMIQLANGREVPVKDVDYEAIRLLLEIDKRRAAILGFEAPKKTQADVTVKTHTEIDLGNLSDAELIQMQDMLERAKESESNKTAIPVTGVRMLEQGE